LNDLPPDVEAARRPEAENAAFVQAIYDQQEMRAAQERRNNRESKSASKR
jgi:hypothetical protein